MVEFVCGGGERERESDHRVRAFRATRPHAVGYTGECDEEQGEIGPRLPPTMLRPYQNAKLVRT